MKNTFNKNYYLSKDVPEKHIIYLKDRIKQKLDRDIIFNNLTSDVRKVDHKIASDMIDDAIGLDIPFFKYSKKKLKNIINRYKMLNVDERHIIYAFSEINRGKDDKLIIQNLSSNLRMLPISTAENLLDELKKLQSNYLLVYVTSICVITLIGQIVILFIFASLGFEKAIPVVVITMVPNVLLIFRLLYELIKKLLKIKIHQN